MVFENVEISFVIAKIDSTTDQPSSHSINEEINLTLKRTICCSSRLAASFFPVLLKT